VSKMKRRYFKRNGGQKRKVAGRSACDNHHICFVRRKWNGGSVGELRRFHYCILSIPRATLHRAIHENLAYIPVPRDSSAKEALAELRSLEKYGAISDDDSLEKRLNLLAALFDCTEQPTADGFRKQLEIVREFKDKPP